MLSICWHNKMYLLIWLLTFPSILYHSLFILIIVFVFIYYKASYCLFKSNLTEARIAHYQEYLKFKKNSLITLCRTKISKANVIQPISSTGPIFSMAIKRDKPFGAAQISIVLLALISLNPHMSILCLEEVSRTICWYPAQVIMFQSINIEFLGCRAHKTFCRCSQESD